MHNTTLANDLGGVLVFVGFILFIVAAVAVFRVRKIAILAFCGSLVSCLAGGGLLPAVPDPPPSKSQAASPAQPNLTPAALQEVQALQGSMSNDIDHCSAANKLAGQRLVRYRSGHTTLQTAYDTTAWALDTCHLASKAVGDLEPPPSAEKPVREAYQRALESCHDSLIDKQAVLDRLKALLNGEEKPSDVHDFSQDVDDSQAQDRECLGAYAYAVTLTAGQLHPATK